jgi:hypothetical protein
LILILNPKGVAYWVCEAIRPEDGTNWRLTEQSQKRGVSCGLQQPV